MTATATTASVDITMPKLSDSMEEGTILQWLKASGDDVARGEPLVEVETDKASVVYEAERDGVLGELLVAEGDAAALGAPIARLLVADDGTATPTAAPAPAEATAGAAASPSPVAAPPRRSGAGRRVRATPVARRVAADLGVALDALTGTGPGGRVVRADVLAASAADVKVIENAGEAPLEPERLPLTTTQRTIAKRMVASRTEIPEFTLTAEIDMTAALRLRRDLAEAGTKVSVNDMVVKACGLVLREQPALNTSWGGDHLVRHRSVNVGIAVAAGDALLVPVVADADTRPLAEIARAARALGERARDRTITPGDLAGGTFTVSNLGMFGIQSFDAVINAPQSGILAVGATERRPVFDDDDNVTARDLMRVSLSCDHRVVYGADGARFLQRLREVLERPLTLLLTPTKDA